MIEKKHNKALLDEELKRHKNIVEYTFYVGEDDDVVGDPEEKDLLLGEDPEDEEDEMPDGEMSGDEMDDEPMGDEPMGDEPMGNDIPDEEGGIPDEEPSMEEPETGGEDEIELDVTELVQGTEEAKMSADMANEKMAELIQQFNVLNTKLSELDDVEDKIAELEDEVIRRNPTKVENLEMRSLDSFPYNLKLSDYWENKESEGKYNAVDGNNIESDGTEDIENLEDSEDSEEYILRKSDVDNDFNQQQIPRTFDIDDEEDEDELDKFNFLK